MKGSFPSKLQDSKEAMSIGTKSCNSLAPAENCMQKLGVQTEAKCTSAAILDRVLELMGQV